MQSLLFFFIYCVTSMENKSNQHLFFEHLHRAVRPLLMADKVVGGEHHLADIAVKTRFVPVLSMRTESRIISRCLYKTWEGGPDDLLKAEATSD